MTQHIDVLPYIFCTSIEICEIVRDNSLALSSNFLHCGQVVKHVVIEQSQLQLQPASPGLHIID